MVEPDFSDDEGDEDNSIVTSSQRELAHITILSINTPMKHRLKNRAARLKEQRSNKQLYKDATGCEELPAFYDHDAHDTVDPLAALKHDLGLVEAHFHVVCVKCASGSSQSCGNIFRYNYIWPLSF